jgi:hypothetical protein
MREEADIVMNYVLERLFCAIEGQSKPTLHCFGPKRGLQQAQESMTP